MILYGFNNFEQNSYETSVQENPPLMLYHQRSFNYSNMLRIIETEAEADTFFFIKTSMMHTVTGG